jgi:RND superfamily putative drug exporter
MLQPYGSRPAVRQLLLWDDPEEKDAAAPSR